MAAETDLSGASDENEELCLVPRTKKDADGIVSRMKALLDAVKYNNEDGVRGLVDAGMDINITYSKGKTILFCAVQQDNEKMVQLLVDVGADVNITDRNGGTVLFCAVQQDNERMVQLLVDVGADVNITDSNGQTVLFYAVRNNNETMVDLLISFGADVNIKASMEVLGTRFDSTALEYAVNDSNESIVNKLLEAGADVNTICGHHDNALIMAVGELNERIIFRLIDAGGDVNIVDGNGTTLLWIAALQQNVNVVCKLIKAGVDINIATYMGSPAFHMSMSFSRNDERTTKVVRAFVEDAHADVNARDESGRTPLFYAIIGSISLSSYLIEKGANLFAKDNYNVSILTYYIQNLYYGSSKKPISPSDLECLDIFLQHGVERGTVFETAINVLFSNVLSFELKKGRLQSLLLLARDFIPKSKSKSKFKFKFKFNVKHGNDENMQLKREAIIDSLLSMLSTECTDTKSCYGSLEPMIFDSLIKLGANLDSVDSSGNTALHHAIDRLKYNQVSQETVMKICHQLDSFGVSYNIRNHSDETPLLSCLSDLERYQIFEYQIPVDVCRFLLEHGASAEETTKEGLTFFHLILQFFKTILTSNKLERLQELMKLFQLFLDENLYVNKSITINKRDSNLNSPLHLWASLALRSNGDYNKPLFEDYTFEKLLKTVLMGLLRFGAKLNDRNKDEQTPLHLCRTWIAVKLLIDAGANSNDVDSSGRSPLLNAAARGRVYLIYVVRDEHFYPDVLFTPKAFWKTAIEKGLDPWIVDKHGKSVLSFLIQEEKFVLSKSLLEVACEDNYLQSETIAASLLNAICKDASTRAHWKSNLVEIILQSTRDPNPGRRSDSPLHLCCRNIVKSIDEKRKRKRREVIEMISQSTREPTPGSCSDSHLHYGCRNIVDTFHYPFQIDDSNQSNDFYIDIYNHIYDDDIDDDTNSNIPSWYKCMYDYDFDHDDEVHWTIAKLLLKYGADYKVHDSTGQSCLDIAEEYSPLKDLLLKPIDIDDVPLLIPWTSVSRTHEDKLGKVARRQETRHNESFWYHKDHIQSGSFGAVFAGINEKDGREVAIKRIEKLRMPRPEDKREITSLAHLADCEQVVRYLCFFEDEYFSYVVLELMEGNLDEFLDKPAIKTETRAQLCGDIVIGLEYLHRQNIIHRDLKPTNILYRTHPRLCLKIADFGLSRCVDSSSTTVMGTSAGTRCWIAPEILKTSRVYSTSSDMFSCGLVLHYILSSKRHPFAPADCSNKCLIQISFETESNIRNGNKEGWDNSVCPEAIHLVQKMLEGDESKRPTAAEAPSHPLFWSKEKKIKLLVAVGNQDPEFTCPRAKRSLPISAVETDLEANYSTIVRCYPSWNDSGFVHMPVIFSEMTKKRSRYDTLSLVELVRFIRNAYSHVSEISHRNLLLEDYVFLEYFPDLVMEVFKAVTTHGWDQTRDEIINAMK